MSELTHRHHARGRELAHERIARLTPVAAQAREALGRCPTLAIIAPGDPESRKFAKIKQDALAQVDLIIQLAWIESGATTADVIQLINDMNSAPDVDAIFLQFPLPDAIDVSAAANSIALEKDIDLSSDAALARLAAGTARFDPAAPAATRDLLQDELGTLTARAVVVLGEDDAFTKALRYILKREGASCSLVGAAGDAGSEALADAEAIVVASDIPPASHIQLKRTPVLLDAGYYLPPRHPDFIPEAWKGQISVHLTQYGNVGPLTVAHLAAATVAAALE